MAHREQEKPFKDQDTKEQLIFQKEKKVNCLNDKVVSLVLILDKALGIGTEL
jgi:hypothetical protein